MMMIAEYLDNALNLSEWCGDDVRPNFSWKG
jgi:hypothetical protein